MTKLFSSFQKITFVIFINFLLICYFAKDFQKAHAYEESINNGMSLLVSEFDNKHLIRYLICKVNTNCNNKNYDVNHKKYKLVYKVILNNNYRGNNILFFYDRISTVINLIQKLDATINETNIHTYQNYSFNSYKNENIAFFHKVLWNCDELYARKDTSPDYKLAGEFSRLYFVDCIFEKKILSNEIYVNKNGDYKYFSIGILGVPWRDRLSKLQFDIARGRSVRACKTLLRWSSNGYLQDIVQNAGVTAMSYLLLTVRLLQNEDVCKLERVIAVIKDATIVTYRHYFLLYAIMRTHGYVVKASDLIIKAFQSAKGKQSIFCWNLNKLKSEIEYNDGSNNGDLSSIIEEGCRGNFDIAQDVNLGYL